MPFTSPILPPGEPALAPTPYRDLPPKTGAAPMADRRLRIDRSAATEEFGLACQRLIPWPGGDAEPPVGAMACFLKPGGDSDPDCHDQDEVMLILSGTGSVTLDGRLEPPFRTGDLVVLPRNQEHVVHNTGDTELSWVSLYWPLREPAVRTDNDNEEVAA
ncbi:MULTISPECIES: cupin domain-containing protein [Streptomyces]|uniref:Mannose-6-phosphate isomerase-like protein (Cupin superfamily) n=1 Tax=Streptomyces nymphaeiformis TaxID=2663842 RepID=A0A7W7TZ37_9ACTN|nr:cupin domain-containing protein [Streptomyces nymphaeiformis]MBB4982034.1 mannose-6-phosphate isomerase-like protein (cupin superfamily) [Streptomyces nymphaeiformis]